MRVLMTGGGTGGHINPAIAIAKIIERNEPGSEIVFVGTPRGMENRLVPREGYELRHIDICGFDRKNPFNNIKTLGLMATSVGKAKKLIREFSPDVCIGTGGYVSWPLIRAAEEMKIPTAMHEANALAGAAIKALAPHLDLLLTNFDGMESQVKCRNVVHCGNPLRKGFDSALTREEAYRRLGFDGKYERSLLSFGGSLGAASINDVAMTVMTEYSAGRDGLHHLHQTGTRYYEAEKTKFTERGLDAFGNLVLTDYIYDMPERLVAADLVICRAGAMTVSELALLGKPAILIPSPNVTDNHQYKNAKALADKGAAVLIEEKDIYGEKDKLSISDTVMSLIEDENKLKEMSEAISGFAVRNADKIIYSSVRSILR